MSQLPNIATTIVKQDRMTYPLRASDFEVGDKFKINHPIYKNGKVIFTVQAVFADWIDCADSEGRYNHNVFSNENFEFYGNKIRSVGCCEHLTDAQYSDYTNHVAESEERVRKD